MKKSQKIEKWIENKRPNVYYFDLIRQSIPNQNKVVSKDREDTLEYFLSCLQKRNENI